MEKHINEVEEYVSEPAVQAVWSYRHPESGILLNNYQSGKSKVFYVERDVLVSMIWGPTPAETFTSYARIKPHEIADAQNKKLVTANVIHIRYQVIQAVMAIEEGARMALLANKLTWLEENPYPENRVRKYFPIWYYESTKVEACDGICMECHAIPDKVNNMLKPVWRVWHISNESAVNTASLRTPPPSENDQFFKCPTCAGTWKTKDYILSLKVPFPCM